MIGWIGRGATWLGAQYIQDYRESRARVFDLITQNNLRLNTVILTVSIASLTAVAALNDRVFLANSWLSVIVVALFILTILLSTINFFLSGLVLSDFHQKLNKDIVFPFRVSRGEYKPKYQKTQNILNTLVLGGFCIGLVAFLVLLSFHILGSIE